MSDQTIKSIHGVEPMREGEYPMYYKVGIDGVTEIIERSTLPEPYCERIHYLVYRGDRLVSKVNDSAVAEVIYS
jgi:hypothetical protein